MSMRLVFKTVQKASNWDLPEKTKQKTRGMFKIAPDLPIKIGSQNPAPVCERAQDVHYYEDDDGSIEVDLHYCMKMTTFLVCFVVFVGSVFACGNAYAAQDQYAVHRIWTPQDAEKNIDSIPTAATQTIPTTKTIQPVVPNATNIKLDESKVHQPSAERSAPVEYVQLSFQFYDSRQNAIGSVEQCTRLVLQSLQFNILELLLERGRILLRTDEHHSLQSGDALIESLSQKHIAEKLQACARIQLQGDPMFTYR
jgi:hypothetical protein